MARSKQRQWMKLDLNEARGTRLDLNGVKIAYSVLGAVLQEYRIF